jgi:hypothetical protein
MSIKGREPTPNDSAVRTRLIRRWVAAHAPEGATMESWGSAKCGLARKGEFPGCDIFAINVPSTGEKIDYYFYAGNWETGRLRNKQPNNRFERSRGRVFGGSRRESMIGINCLRFAPAQPRVAQPHR